MASFIQLTAPIDVATYKPRPVYASVWRSGLIEVGTSVPGPGALVLFRFADWYDGRRASDVISAAARRERGGSAIVAPGVPEAESEDQALAAVMRFHDRLVTRLDDVLGRDGYHRFHRSREVAP